MNSRQLLEAATALHQKGNLAEAERLYAELLGVEPANAQALRLLGLLRAHQGRNDEALELIAAALARDPNSAIARLNYGNVLKSLGRIDDALASYDWAIALAPDFVEALSNRGVILCQQGRYEEGLANFGAILAINPDFAFALNNRGLALRNLARFAEALADFEHAVALEPRNAVALNNRGLALQDLGRFVESLASYEAALRVQPDYIAAWIDRGNVLCDLRRFEDAVASFDRALALRPDHAEAHYNRGNALSGLNRLDEALASYARAVTLKPRYAEAFNNRGNAFLDLNRFAEALASYERVLAIEPDHPRALGGVAAALLNLCDWPRIAAVTGAVRARASVLPPFTLLSYSTDGRLQLECARSNVRERMPAPPPPLSDGTVRSRGRIRIAYLSQDFAQHPVAFQIAELIQRHDHVRFEVLGISTGPDDGSAIRRRLVAGFDRFHDVRARDDRAVAELLWREAVDILIDLGGHTRGARLEILGHRPCPVQVNYLGYAGTTGADFVDYVIGDAIATPFDHQPFFSERIVHLPDSFFVSDTNRALGPAPSRAEAGLPERGIVFCSFNKSWKITGSVFAVWMRLLRAVPESVLWLRSESEDARVHFRAAARAAGVDPTRIVFAPRVAGDVHLARHRLADLFLDTLPYNAHATACDALWAGLPLVTCCGETFAGRVGASLLRAAGLDELVTANLEDYEALALGLARDPERLRSVRQKLAENRTTHALFDTDRSRRNLEAAYTTMWKIAARGDPPHSFAVVPPA